MNDLHMTWHDSSSGVVHAVTAYGAYGEHEGSIMAREISTDCGIELVRLVLEAERPVTCPFCLESDWLEEALSGLEDATEETSEREPSVAVPDRSASSSATLRVSRRIALRRLTSILQGAER